MVYLDVNWRHSSSQQWCRLLQKWRRGDFKPEDVEYFNTNIALADQPNFMKGFTPYITSSHVVRKKVNNASLIELALTSSSPIYRFPALRSTQGGKHIWVDGQWQSLPDNSTDNMPMLLDLVIGMPIQCTKNFKNDRIANGAKMNTFNYLGLTGNLVGIQWPSNIDVKSDLCVNKHIEGGITIITPKTCTIPELLFIKTVKKPPYHDPRLPTGVMAIHPYNHNLKLNLTVIDSQPRHKTATVIQFPIVPAFAITTDKSQGQTFDGCYIGAQINEHRINPPASILYVALSRGKDPNYIRSTEGVSLEYLQHFVPNKQLLELDLALLQQAKSYSTKFRLMSTD